MRLVFGTVRMNESARIEEFEEKAYGAKSQNDLYRNLCNQKKASDRSDRALRRGRET